MCGITEVLLRKKTISLKSRMTLVLHNYSLCTKTQADVSKFKPM